MTPQAPFSRPLYVMAKPAGSACNMRCRYCYYLEKAGYYPVDKAAPGMLMTDEILEEYTRQYIEAQATPRVMFTWHGGESLLRPISFYEKALKYQAQYARGIGVDNSIQTNGTLITDEWARFFKDNNFLVGVSIDGPAEHHDRYRLMAKGGPSHAAVMRGIETLNRHGVEWNAMAVVNDINSRQPLEFYRFFKSIDCRYIQFTPIVERTTARGALTTPGQAGARLTPWSVNPRQWGEFLCTVFSDWVMNDVGTTYVQLFDSTLANWCGTDPGVCTLAPTCGHAAAIEHNGDLYSCDHYVFPDYLLGNIRHNSIFELMSSQRQMQFGLSKQTSLPRQCRECKFLTLCNGECPKNRISTTLDGEKGLNYLCQGYRRYFEYTAPAMAWMRDAIRDRRAPAGIMDVLKNAQKER